MQFGSYKCVCKSGYVSEDCSIQENPEIECNDAEPDRQCQHGGVCIYDELKNNKTCECPKGYEGNFGKILENSKFALFQVIIAKNSKLISL